MVEISILRYLVKKSILFDSSHITQFYGNSMTVTDSQSINTDTFAILLPVLKVQTYHKLNLIFIYVLIDV